MTVEKSKIPMASAISKDRILSLDFFRGLTMFLLIGESTHIYEHMADPSLKGTIISAIGGHFHHHPWNGLRFWDLIQPFFMFIVGAALAFSVAKREARGESRRRITRHAVLRAAILLLIGWALYCIEPGRITFRFQNVLAQLSVTYIIAYFMMKRRAAEQIALSFGLILLTEVIYRVFWVPGFNQPFVPDHNFGSWVDMLISGELSSGHWVSFNAIPTTAHTIWGVLAGQLLLSEKPPKKKAMILALTGIAGVAIGFGLNPVTPIIKRICTSSFVIASGGFCLLALAFSYWFIDMAGFRRWTKFFNIVGMNSLAIYLFTESGGTSWVLRLVKPFAAGFFSWMGELPVEVIASAASWAVLWSMCYWLFRRKILIKI
jgi:predicted acyltransferase